MYTLTKKQKLANLEETLTLKEKKLSNLSEEVRLLRTKIRKLQSSLESETPGTVNDHGRIKTSTDLNLIPAASRDQYEYDPSGPSYEEIHHLK